MKAASLHPLAEATVGGPGIRASPFLRETASWPVAVLGVTVDNVTATGAADRIASLVRARAGHRVEVVTTRRFFRSQHDPQVWQSLVDADLVLADSVTLLWISRWLGNRLQERIRTEHLMRELAARARRCDWRVFLLADGPAALATLQQAFSDSPQPVVLCGVYAPSAGTCFDDWHARQELAAAKPDLVLVHTDALDLERWPGLHPSAAETAVWVRLGGRGCEPSCPKVIGAPSRSAWERLRNLLHLARRTWRQRAAASFAGLRIDQAAFTRRAGAWIDVDAGVNLTRAAFDRGPEIWREPVAAERHLTIDLSHVRRIDATGIAMLARRHRECLRDHRHCVLIAPSPTARAALEHARLWSRFEIAATVHEARRLVPVVASHVVPGVTRSLAWCGEIIAANVDDVWQMTTDYVHTFVAHGATLVVIDLGRLRFIDSAGAALMLRVKRWARELRTEILFARPQPPVVSVLRLTSAENMVLEGAQ